MKKTITLSIDIEVNKRLNDYVEKNASNKSKLVQKLIEEFLNRNDDSREKR